MGCEADFVVSGVEGDRKRIKEIGSTQQVRRPLVRREQTAETQRIRPDGDMNCAKPCLDAAAAFDSHRTTGRGAGQVYAHEPSHMMGQHREISAGVQDALNSQRAGVGTHRDGDQRIRNSAEGRRLLAEGKLNRCRRHVGERCTG